MKKKILSFSTFTLVLASAIAFLTLSSFNRTSMPLLEPVYYYRVTINYESSIPSNATGYVKVHDSNGDVWQVPYVHGISTYNIPASWNHSSITACPSLSLNVNVPMLPYACGTFSSPFYYCIGSLQIVIGGDEH